VICILHPPALPGWRFHFRRRCNLALLAPATAPAHHRRARADLQGAAMTREITSGTTADPTTTPAAATPAATPTARDVWFDSAGTPLFAIDSGDGPPIVLLHGGLATHLACRVFARPLARFRVITPDLRASGRSIYRGALDWDRLADDVVALLDHLGVARAVIGGISFGAGVAVRTALRHPARTAGLVVLTPAFAGGDTGLTAAQDAAMRAMDAAGQRSLTEGVQVLLPLLDGLPAELRERARPVFLGYDAASVAASTRFMASGVQPFAASEDLAAIAAPALVVPGADPTHPPEVAAIYHRHLQRCTMCETDAMGYADAIAAFVDRLPAAQWLQ
jgi:pimeloyl-ACP methyl ester carboxylesterase